MMLENYSTAGISITQDIPRGGCQTDLHIFDAQRKRLENNAAN